MEVVGREVETGAKTKINVLSSKDTDVKGVDDRPDRAHGKGDVGGR